MFIFNENYGVLYLPLTKHYYITTIHERAPRKIALSIVRGSRRLTLRYSRLARRLLFRAYRSPRSTGLDRAGWHGLTRWWRQRGCDRSAMRAGSKGADGGIMIDTADTTSGSWSAAGPSPLAPQSGTQSDEFSLHLRLLFVYSLLLPRPPSLPPVRAPTATASAAPPRKMKRPLHRSRVFPSNDRFPCPGYG